MSIPFETRSTRALRRMGLMLPLLVAAAGCSGTMGAGMQPIEAPAATDADPRIGLGAGLTDAEEAISNLALVAHVDRPQGFFDAQDPGSFSFANSDMAFSGQHVFVGNYNGFQVYDIANPARPTLRKTVVCPGGQGDVSVYRNLLFMSVEETRGRLDCGVQGVDAPVSTDRFRGVRIFDISNLDEPRQVGAIQTCRGSHTHTLVTRPGDNENVYVYVSGTGQVRPGAELEGCSGLSPTEDPNTSYFRIEVVQVPLAAPQQARVVSEPRIFADAEGNVAGLWAGGAHGPGTQETSQTNQCHDITVYPEIGLAGGACAGNGLLLDISDPINPRRIAEVSDPNFAYWHSATFNNDGSKVLYTDEWGGGSAPRCRESDRPEWGADAIFTLDNRTLQHAGYYKLPAPQTATENCVAHNGSLIPVPGRDIMVQAWYQGGISVFDFTDPNDPVEIAFFDRGPISAEQLMLGGYWSAYWYNGNVYGSEIGRGLDVFELRPSRHLTQNEIDAAKSVRLDWFNPQLQQKLTWPASFTVARAYLDQLERNDGLENVSQLREALISAERMQGAARGTALTELAGRLDSAAASAADQDRVRALIGVLREMAG